MSQTAGFLELQHTADWELKVWAPDLPGLFEQAALGMYTLSGVQLGAGMRQGAHLDLTALDPESLLVKFLSELLYLGERDGLGFDQFEILLTDRHLDATLHGAAIASLAKEIKAVTYHNLAIRHGARGYEVQIVFDV